MSLEELSTAYPKHIWLKFSPDDRELAWQKTNSFSNAATHWNGYINSICLNLFKEWLREEEESEQIRVWPDETAQTEIWELVNGSALMMGETRIVIIPGLFNQELAVPAEWVDIPEWAANYYIAVELNLAECWFRIFGIATHQMVKDGYYDASTRSYCLERDELLQTMNVFWVANKLGLNEQPVVDRLPAISAVQADNLIKELSRSTASFCRLELPFQQWAALLTNSDWRSTIYQQRAPQKPIVKLSQWLKGKLTESLCAGWVAIEDILNATQMQFAYGAATRSSDKQLSVGLGKVIDLGIGINKKQVALIVITTPAEAEKVKVKMRLFPAGGDSILPEGIRLIFVTAEGQTREVVARSRDNLIQLPELKVAPGRSFTLQVALANSVVGVDFNIEPLTQ